MDSNAIASQLVEYDKQRKSSNDVLTDAMSKYGIPEIRNRVSGLRTTLSNTESALNAVDPSVTGRTQGSLVTEAQRQRQVANERAPIAEQYGQQSRALATESGNLSDSLSAAKLVAENQLNDYNAGRSALQSQYSIASGREAEARRQLEADRAFALQKQAAADLGGYNLGGGETKQAAPAISDEQRAYNAIEQLMQTRNTPLIARTYAAIKAAADRGSAYDKIKLDLLHQKYGNSLSKNNIGINTNINDLRF